MKKFQDVIKETRKVAMKKPLGHNTESVYVTAEGEPCCIFGHVLNSLNLLDKLGQAKALNNYTFADLPWQDWGVEPPTDYERLWTLKVQSAADNGSIWGVGVLLAELTMLEAAYR